MEYWVYITEFKEAALKVAFSLAIKKIIPTLKPYEKIVYLCPFKVPFDALAHKYLLEHLSKKSVLIWVNNHKEETKLWLDFIFKKETQ